MQQGDIARQHEFYQDVELFGAFYCIEKGKKGR
jgi:hypothetical protein